MVSTRNLADGFFTSARQHPERPAVSLGDDELSYQRLSDWARRLGATLLDGSNDEEPALTGIFGHRSFAAVAGILGSLAAGRSYVPLNPLFPAERSRQMVRKSGLRRIIAEADSVAALAEVLAGIDEPLWVIFPDLEEPPDLGPEAGHHRLQAGASLSENPCDPQAAVGHDDIAYLLFTSGSTGDPKGVMVMHRNVTHFVDFMTQRYDVGPSDRLSQTFDLTFDLSVFDMFVAWERGACVCFPTRAQKMLPAKYISSQALTIWFSVPSTAIMMRKLRMLKASQYPQLRWALFCGEALPIEVAEAFQQAAPNAIVENLYGPTELTIACSYYRFEPERCAADAELGVVPIGEPYPEMVELIVDENLHTVADGEAGELLMAGPQVAKGYWQDSAKTDAAFLIPPGQQTRFYRTGDRVKRRSVDGPLLYLGRVDGQIKVQGYRVELGEIEAALRDAAGVDTAIALGFPESANGADGVIAFLARTDVPEAEIHQRLQQRLPSYMQPTEYHQLDSFPLNANGKVDRKALRQRRLEQAG